VGPVSQLSAIFVTTVAVTLEAFLLPLADRLRSAGWRVDALANGAPDRPALAAHFNRLLDIAWSRSPLDPRNLIGTTRQIRRIVADADYDIVHVHTPVAAFVTRLALRSRVPQSCPSVIYTAHGFHFFAGQNPLKYAAYRSTERVAARWTDYLVTVNREDYGAARGFGTIDADSVRLIPGVGVDTQVYQPRDEGLRIAPSIRDDLGIARDAFMLTVVAELSPVKRHLHLFKALALIRDPRVVLVIVGTGPHESSLREQARTLGIEARLRWAGYRTDVARILSESDALVLCSQREGLNRSILEAMASGLPIIGTQTRGIADLITPETGWVVPKDDVAALAAGIMSAVGDPCSREKGRAGRRRVIEAYSLPQITSAYEELYHEALTSRV